MRLLPIVSTAPAAGCDCRRCPWYSGDDHAAPQTRIAAICSGCNADCSYCGCARAELAAPRSGCASCPVRCGSRTDITAWMADVGDTLEFDDITLERPLPGGLPAVIPQVDGSELTGWDAALAWPAYGVGLRRVFSPSTHALYPRFRGRDAHQVLGLTGGQRTVLVGYGEDPLVEAFWTLRRRERLVEQIAAGGWDLVLAPNYSIFGNWPRAQQLLSMRMSLLIAAEFADAGVPAVPNVYWFRLEDLCRWAEWIRGSSPPAIAINLQTVREGRNWDSWALPGLYWLAENIDEQLPVILTGLSRADRIATARELFGPRLRLVSQNPAQYALHGAVMTAAGREDRKCRPADAFAASVRYLDSLLTPVTPAGLP